MARLENEILKLLAEGKSMSLHEISQIVDKKPKTVFKALRKLFEKDKISSNPITKKYSLFGKAVTT